MYIELLRLLLKERTFDTVCYRNEVLDPSYDALTFTERLSVYFQQDSDTPHTIKGRIALYNFRGIVIKNE